MVDVVKQLCIKSFELTAENGDHFEVKQGDYYTTTKDTNDKGEVVVFRNFWVRVPESHFVLQEGYG